MRSPRLKLSNVIGFCSALLFVTSVWAGDWRIHVISLGAKQTKIQTIEGEIAHLVAEKNHSTDPERLKTVTDEIAKAYGELQKESEKYREEFLHVRFKHPERGDESERSYSREKLKANDDLETDFGIDARLDRIKTKVQRVYGIHTPEPRKPSSTTKALRGLASESAEAESQRIRLAK